MDWHCGFVLGWEPSNTMDTGLCLAAMETALAQGQPEIFNSDQRSQFTSVEFTSARLATGVLPHWRFPRNPRV